MSSRINGGAFLSAIVLLSGCGSSSSEANLASPAPQPGEKASGAPAPEAGAARDPESMTLLTYQASPLSAAGRVTGKLDLVGNCLVIRIGESRSEGFVPVFPEGRVRWDSKNRAVVLNGRAHPVGASVDFGGGSYARNATDVAIRGERSSDCPDFNYWLVPLNN
ncbi:MAG TPA: hypothetical protein VF652_02395 [Allosphingosinicella sp.]